MKSPAQILLTLAVCFFLLMPSPAPASGLIDRRGDVFVLRSNNRDGNSRNYDYELLKLAADDGKTLWHRSFSVELMGAPSLRLDCAGNPILYHVWPEGSAKFLILDGQSGNLVCYRVLGSVAKIDGDVTKAPERLLGVPFGLGESGFDLAGGFYFLHGPGSMMDVSIDYSKETFLCRYEPKSGQTTHRIPFDSPTGLMKHSPLVDFRVKIETQPGGDILAIMSGAMGKQTDDRNWDYYFACSRYSIASGIPRWIHRFPDPVQGRFYDLSFHISSWPSGGVWIRGGPKGWSALDTMGKATTVQDANPHLSEKFSGQLGDGRTCDSQGSLILSFTTESENTKYLHGLRKFNSQGKLIWTTPALLAKHRLVTIFVDADDSILAVESLSDVRGEGNGGGNRLFKIDGKNGLLLKTLDIKMESDPDYLKEKNLLVAEGAENSILAIDTKTLRVLWEKRHPKNAIFAPDEVIKVNGPTFKPGKKIAWYSKDGKMTEGEFISVREGGLVFACDAGKEMKVQLEKLSPDSRQLAELLSAVAAGKK